MVLRSLISTSLLASLLAACGGAKFTGTAPSTAQSEPNPQANDPVPGNSAGSGAPSGTPGSQSSANASSQPSSTASNSSSGSNPSANPSTASNTAASNTAASNTAANNNGTSPSDSGAASSVTPAGPANPAAPSTPVPACTAGHKAVGARLAFLIDNSGSNSSTDCPNAVKGGTSNGTDTLYTCGAQTNREQAVLAAYDLLAGFGAQNASSALAQSQVAIASFPTAADMFGYDYTKSWTNQTAGWLNISAANRGKIASTMLFTRAPLGQTPYGAAMNAAQQLFNGTPNDGRLNVAILVTDGEPTDRNPAAVLAQANALKAAGIHVIVLDYNGTPAASAAADTTLMTNIDNATVRNGQGHWYTSNYADMSSYLQDLIGTNGQGGLAAAVATSGSVISVQNSSALSSAINSLVSSQAVACSP